MNDCVTFATLPYYPYKLRREAHLQKQISDNFSRQELLHLLQAGPSEGGASAGSTAGATQHDWDATGQAAWNDSSPRGAPHVRPTALQHESFPPLQGPGAAHTVLIAEHVTAGHDISYAAAPAPPPPAEAAEPTGGNDDDELQGLLADMGVQGVSATLC